LKLPHAPTRIFVNRCGKFHRTPRAFPTPEPSHRARPRSNPHSLTPPAGGKFDDFWRNRESVYIARAQPGGFSRRLAPLLRASPTGVRRGRSLPASLTAHLPVPATHVEGQLLLRRHLPCDQALRVPTAQVIGPAALAGGGDAFAGVIVLVTAPAPTREPGREGLARDSHRTCQIVTASTIKTTMDRYRSQPKSDPRNGPLGGVTEPGCRSRPA
jgi:hypothetical protein